MCTHNLCFEQNYENSQIVSTENSHFYSSEISLYIAWACFRKDLMEETKSQTKIFSMHVKTPGKNIQYVVHVGYVPRTHLEC